MCQARLDKACFGTNLVLRTEEALESSVLPPLLTAVPYRVSPVFVQHISDQGDDNRADYVSHGNPLQAEIEDNLCTSSVADNAKVGRSICSEAYEV